MQSFLTRLPDADFFQRNGHRIGGFVAGAVGTLLIGLYPQPVLDTAKPALQSVQQYKKVASTENPRSIRTLALDENTEFTLKTASSRTEGGTE